MTELKQSQSGYKYFNFILQTKHQYLQGVCFDANLHNQLSKQADTQKCLPVSNYNLKPEWQNPTNFTIVITRYSKIHATTQYQFQHQTPDCPISKINAIQEATDFSVVVIKAQVHIISAPKKVKTANSDLQKIQCKAADDTAAIRMTVWQDKINTFKDGHFYKIAQCRIRSYQNQKYLSVGCDTKITELETVDFQPVADIDTNDNPDELITITVNKLDGVQQIDRFHKCKKCGCKLNPLQSRIHTCEVCGLSQMISPLYKQHQSKVEFIPPPQLQTIIYSIS